MKYKYEYFELDISSVTREDIATVVSLIHGGGVKISCDYVWWNPLGSYVMWCDGDNWSFYFCKNYIRIKGINIFDQKDIEKAIEYLYKKTNL